MDVMANFVLVLLLCFACCTAIDNVFDRVLGSMAPCEEVCENSYKDHTYEKGLHRSYCKRGCRLFSILDFVHEGPDMNVTREECVAACSEAYSKTEDQLACNNGCFYQVPFAVKRHRMLEESAPAIHALMPVMYIQEMYVSVKDRLTRTMTTGWSYFIQPDNGRVLVVQNQPRTFTEYMKPSDTNDYKTSNYFETSLSEVDNSATPNLRHSQIRSVVSDLNLAGRDAAHAHWLDCVSKRTGLPRLLLSCTIFLSAMAMVWICFTAAVTAREHKTPSQKLSIYGDIEYEFEPLNKLQFDVDEKPRVHGGQQLTASPLKVHVEKI